jgi:hypothetical protein
MRLSGSAVNKVPVGCCGAPLNFGARRQSSHITVWRYNHIVGILSRHGAKL